MLKKLSSILISLGLAASVTVSAVCLSASRFIQSVSAADGSVRIICSALDYGEAAVTLDGTPLPSEISSIGESGTPVTVYCLADVSNSISDSMMEQEKQVLQKISDLMRDGDGMVISALGNSSSNGEVLTTADERSEAINSLEHGNYNTNLYAGIVDSLKILRTDSTMNEKCCLIILSDGNDYYKAGITESEVNSAIEDSRVPIYTVAVMPNNYGSEYSDSAKALGSFARTSVGGLHFAPMIDGITAEDAGSGIWDDILNGTVVTASLEGFALPDSKNDLSLKASYTTGNVTVEDSADISYSEVKAALPEAEPIEEAVVEQDDEKNNTEQEINIEPDVEKEGLSTAVIAIIAVAAVVIIAAIIAAVVISNKKKKKRLAEEERLKKEAEEKLRLEQEAKRKAEEQRRRANAPKPVAQVRLISIGNNSLVSSFDLYENKPVIIGRNPAKAAVVPNERDSKLSGAHCSIRADGREIYIRDENSTNGTFINGTRLSRDELRKLSADADIKLTAGMSDYRVLISYYDKK